MNADQPDDLQALEHHDSPRTQLQDRAHDMLQRQIDALLTHARTVTHQIADLTVRAQRMDSELATSNRAVTTLAATVEAHMHSTDKRASAMERRLDEVAGGQLEILTAIKGSADLLQQMRDGRTAARVLAGLVRGTSGILLAMGVILGAAVALARFIQTHPPT